MKKQNSKNEKVITTKAKTKQIRQKTKKTMKKMENM